MPKMDGIETTKIIREMGYTLPVVALTANAVAGQSDIFLANGFDGFISKPIDTRELNAVLCRFIRDKQPREVIEATRREQRRRENEEQDVPAQAVDSSEIARYFVPDVENAIKTINEAYAEIVSNSDADFKVVHSYITAVHGMKSALSNIGEAELSGVALRLEQAGDEKDMAVITEETPAFVEALKFLVEKYSPTNNETVEVSDNDKAYLRDKLLEIETACLAFDIKAAKNALEALQSKPWPHDVNKALDEISVHLLHSAFKKAVASVQETVKII